MNTHHKKLLIVLAALSVAALACSIGQVGIEPNDAPAAEAPALPAVDTQTDTPADAGPPSGGGNPNNPLETIDLTQGDVRIEVQTSPDGLWVAESVVKFGIEDNGQTLTYSRLQVRRVDGSVVYTPGEFLEPAGLGQVFPEPLFWSPDGSRLYFHYAGTPDGCSFFAFSQNQAYIDLNTGVITPFSVQTAGPPPSFSPDGQLLAYLSPSQNDDLDYGVADLNANTQAIKPIAIRGAATAGNFVWSPDGSQLAFTAVEDPCGANWLHSVVWVQVSDHAQIILVSREPTHYLTVGWDADGILLATVEDPNTIFVLNPQTGEISPR